MSFHARVTSKGQITLPVELRTHLRLAEGDTVEFYFDHLGAVCLRPRRHGVKSFLDALPARQPDPAYETDDDAVAAAILDRDDRSRKKRR